jgi:hypothetical protein
MIVIHQLWLAVPQKTNNLTMVNAITGLKEQIERSEDMRYLFHKRYCSDV